MAGYQLLWIHTDGIASASKRVPIDRNEFISDLFSLHATLRYHAIRVLGLSWRNQPHAINNPTLLIWGNFVRIATARHLWCLGVSNGGSLHWTRSLATEPFSNLNTLSWTELVLRAQELCESGSGHPGLPVPNSPYGLCGRKVTLNWTELNHWVTWTH